MRRRDATPYRRIPGIAVILLNDPKLDQSRAALMHIRTLYSVS